MNPSDQSPQRGRGRKRGKPTRRALSPRDTAGPGDVPTDASSPTARHAQASTPQQPRRSTDWDHVADWYNQLVGADGSEFHRHVIIPGVLTLLDLPRDPLRDAPGRRSKRAARSARRARSGESTADAAPPLRVLDLACGQGVLCRAMAHRGCEVTGVDASAALIDAARARTTDPTALPDAGPPIRYLVADAARLDAAPDLPRDAFDAVTCILAIQNIAVLSPVWRGCARLLAPAGRLVVVMMHPCFRIPKASHWGWDANARSTDDASSETTSAARTSATVADTLKRSTSQKPIAGEKHAGSGAPTRSRKLPEGVEYRRIDRYLTSMKTPIQIHPGSDPAAVAMHFHRPLQAYVNTLADAGFVIDRVDEWPSHKRSDPTDPKAPAQNRARREIPMFLALRARRTATPRQ